MKHFVELYQTIDQTTSTKSKVAAMVSYFHHASPTDAAWAVYFLSGRRLKRLIGPAVLRQWLSEESELPEWLVDETYSRVGDLAETIALLLAKPGKMQEGASLSEWIDQQLIPLRNSDPAQQRAVVTNWWQSQCYEPCFIINKLLTGALRVGVSQALLARAVAEFADLPRPVILHRMMGEWQPSDEFWQQLITHDEADFVPSRPYPFCLASPLEIDVHELGDVTDWYAEWKWDGIRAQLIRRSGETYLWSRGEELIGQRFPEITAMAQSLPEGTVLDGEILAWDSDGVMPFSSLQRRIGRKSAGKTLLQQVPCRFLAYDLMEHDGLDVREFDLTKRRTLLAEIIGVIENSADAEITSTLALSTTLIADSWESLAEQRDQSRDRRVEGLMLKHRKALYHTGRRRGNWWKWKIEPYTVDAVMIYAQAGHGRRSNLFTDYTFGVWDNDQLLPIAKAYSGLNNKQIAELDKWIRRNTIEKFGPVRSVAAEQVFELAFEGISLSKRHKSGIAVRFPRIIRWRQDLSPRDADTLDTVKRLINNDE